VRARDTDSEKILRNRSASSSKPPVLPHAKMIAIPVSAQPQDGQDNFGEFFLVGIVW
jgi:hypothetical protein